MKVIVLGLLAILLITAQAHKQPHSDDDIKPIYQPFDDLPTPSP